MDTVSNTPLCSVADCRDDEALSVDDELAERDPALAQLARAAVSGLAPAGPELRRRPMRLAFEGRPGVLITSPLSVREHGFSLHADAVRPVQ